MTLIKFLQLQPPSFNNDLSGLVTFASQSATSVIKNKTTSCRTNTDLFNHLLWSKPEGLLGVLVSFGTQLISIKNTSLSVFTWPESDMQLCASVCRPVGTRLQRRQRKWEEKEEKLLLSFFICFLFHLPSTFLSPNLLPKSPFHVFLSLKT